MDVCESEQADTAEWNHGVGILRPKTKEVTSRYRSSPPSSLSIPRRSPSPNLKRTVSKPSQLQKRSQSVERKHPSTPSRPSTPVQDSNVDGQLSLRRTNSSRSQERMWPSTMRSLSVSFQSDSVSIPVTKKEKRVGTALTDHTLKSSSNVGDKQAETPIVAQKPTPERKKSPSKGKVCDQSENSKPVDVLLNRLIDQHRWPSRIGGKVSSNSLGRSVDLTDHIRLSSRRRMSLDGTSSSTLPGIGLASLRRMSLDGGSKPLQKSASDVAKLLSLNENVRVGLESITENLSSPQLVSARSSDRMTLTTQGVRSLRHPSPSKNLLVSPSVSRGVSPSRARPSTPPSRGISPSRTRLSNPPSPSGSSTSVLCFITDFRKGKKGASCIEDAHQLRLLHNRYLMWRYANARAEAVLYTQKVYTEKILYSVWNTTLALWNSVVNKRIILQQLTLELKLNSILNGQMACLDDWALLEIDHLSSLSGAVEDLEASTLRLPVVGDAKVDIETLKAAVCSAVDVMQSMGSSICSLLPRVEGMNGLISELAVVAAQEREMLEECESLMASTAAMQIEECSLATHLIQIQQDFQRL